MTEPKIVRRCPRCSLSIKGARVVVVNGGEGFHHRCFVQNGGVDDPLHEFLRRHYPRSRDATESIARGGDAVFRGSN